MLAESEAPKGHVKIGATIPAAVVAAAISLGGTWLMRQTPLPSDAPTAADVRDLKRQIDDLNVKLATLSGQLGALAEDARNAKVIEALKQTRTP
jgi:outer membrane murein-binding lipoprotein Lpp